MLKISGKGCSKCRSWDRSVRIGPRFTIFYPGRVCPRFINFLLGESVPCAWPICFPGLRFLSIIILTSGLTSGSSLATLFRTKYPKIFEAEVNPKRHNCPICNKSSLLVGNGDLHAHILGEFSNWCWPDRALSQSNIEFESGSQSKSDCKVSVWNLVLEWHGQNALTEFRLERISGVQDEKCSECAFYFHRMVDHDCDENLEMIRLVFKLISR